jgi:hypothetical protein
MGPNSQEPGHRSGSSYMSWRVPTTERPSASRRCNLNVGVFVHSKATGDPYNVLWTVRIPRTVPPQTEAPNSSRGQGPASIHTPLHRTNDMRLYSDHAA